MPKGVKRTEKPLPSHLTWNEVLRVHRTIRGIGKESLLVDRGESGYRNQFLEDGRIRYQGEGLEGNQLPLKGNQTLLEALEQQRPLRLFLKERQNVWRELGYYRVRAVEYLWEETEARYVYWFALEPVGEVVGLRT